MTSSYSFDNKYIFNNFQEYHLFNNIHKTCDKKINTVFIQTDTDVYICSSFDLA